MSSTKDPSAIAAPDDPGQPAPAAPAPPAPPAEGAGQAASGTRPEQAPADDVEAPEDAGMLVDEDDLDDEDEGDEDEGDEDGSEAPQAAVSPSGPLRCGFVALIGAPNAGKSTLLNALVGAKVSIVSRKVQTTRALVRGIALDGPAQIIFVDTPGIFRPKRRLDRAMVTTAWGGAGDADLVAVLIDSRKGVDEEAEAILARISELKQRKVLILTKVDVVDRPKLLKLAGDLNAKHDFVATFMVAALNGDGVDTVRRKLGEMMPEGPWLYPEDQVSDAPLRAMAAEITREKLFERLHDELPYQITVETDQWQTRKDGSARIEQTIFVTRESHRMIVLGKGGQTIKAIGQAARRDIEEAADGKVHLFLFVKVRENWIDDPARYREMGLEFPKE